MNYETGQYNQDVQQQISHVEAQLVGIRKRIAYLQKQLDLIGTCMHVMDIQVPPKDIEKTALYACLSTLVQSRHMQLVNDLEGTMEMEAGFEDILSTLKQGPKLVKPVLGAIPKPPIKQ